MSHQRRSTSALLRPIQLTAIFFFTVSGGPYGLEPLLQYTGTGWAFVLLLVTPVIWSLPVILTVLELNGMYPKEGGYYYWVKEGMGDRWGFYEGWWSWLYALTDLAIYPVLFTEYLAFFLPEVTPWKIPLCLALVWLCAAINILGIQPVGRSSLVLKGAVVLPFLFLFIAGIVGPAPVSTAPRAGTTFTGFSLGLYTVMWNYLGWDSASTIAGEVDRPQRSYFVAMFSALIIIVGMYLLAATTSASSGMDAARLGSEGYPALGLFIGGKWLGGLLALGGMASAAGLFLSNLLAITRIPEVIAIDGYFPARLAALHPRHRTPSVSIILCAAIVSVMILWQFADLLIIDVSLYSAALFLEFIALIRLRRLQPGIERPFRISLSSRGLIAMTALPAICLVCATAGILSLDSSHGVALLFAILLMSTGPFAWRAALKRARRPPGS